MKMNVRMHFLIDSNLWEKLKKEADERGMNISELCRERLREGDRLERIEMMVKKLRSRWGHLNQI